jgi:hypothetical protein
LSAAGASLLKGKYDLPSEAGIDDADGASDMGAVATGIESDFDGAAGA